MATSWAAIAAGKPKGGPLQAAPPPISKNNYFTFTGGHRDATQMWNVDGIVIYVQGSCPEIGESTYFAKKHLLTFKGGNADKVQGRKDGGSFDHGTIEGKSKEIFDKRTTLDKADKYGKTTVSPVDGKNSYIICDLVSDTELKQTFAKALKNPDSKAHATLRFNTTAVWTLAADKSWSTSDHCKVQFRKSGNVYLIQHFSG